MIQDLGDMNDEDKLAGSRLCCSRIWFWGWWGVLLGHPSEDASPRTAGERELLARPRLNEE